MPGKVVVGAQWGDEGKGKIIDILASRSDVIVRSQGGNNAGHTVNNSGEVYKLHLVPSGILYPHTLNLIGCGTVIDPRELLSEIGGLRGRGIACENLRIDARAHIVMPWHILLDELSERDRGDVSIGTTARGIGPCYADKAARTGIRMYDLARPALFAEKAGLAGEAANRIIAEIYGEQKLNITDIISEYTEYGTSLKAYVDDVSVLTYQALLADRQVLFEGAQGTLLDIDVGTYPYVTSSHPVAGGVCTGAGIGPVWLGDVLGVCKAYTTRVGKGPFPTELNCGLGELIRQKGAEFGTTTGRPRRVGWFDSVIVRHAVRCNGLTSLAINKLDTLSGLGGLKICTAYRKPDGSLVREFPPVLEELADCEPVYEELEGYGGDICSASRYSELPAACRAYVSRIEELCGCRVEFVGVGPSRSQNLEKL